MRNMKWYIVDGSNNPLCWEYGGWESERVIEFESEEEAKDFLKMVLLNYPDFRMNGAHIVESILYYESGYVSGAEATKLIEEELNEKVV